MKRQSCRGRQAAGTARQECDDDESRAELHAGQTKDQNRYYREGILDHLLEGVIEMDICGQALGDKFNLLDQDGDGELSSEELRAAIVSTLKRTTSPQDAEELIRMLDSDHDGKGLFII